MKNESMRMPRAVWALGFVSLFMDISSEMVHGLLPIFLTTVIGASLTTVGFIEGIGEATTLILKVVSGPLSDHWRKRKVLVFAGYLLGAVSKPLFAIAATTGMVLSARVLDRAGKGIRGAPRDALIADHISPSIRGRAFGLRQTLDNVGSIGGPLIAFLLMHFMGLDFRTIFFLAIVPGLLSVLIVIFAVKEAETQASRKFEFSFKQLKGFSRAFWLVVICGGLFQAARLSEAFLILRSKDYGLSYGSGAAVLIALNLTYTLSVYPAGWLSDRIKRSYLLLTGFFVLAVADVVLGVSTTAEMHFLGIAIWGLHLGLSEGVLSALVADTAPANARGTAFGIFSLVSAVALLVANPLGGFIWEQFGPANMFFAGAGLSIFGFFLFLLFSRKI